MGDAKLSATEKFYCWGIQAKNFKFVKCEYHDAFTSLFVVTIN